MGLFQYEVSFQLYNVFFSGYTLAWLGMSFWGRKGSLMLSMILSGLLCVGAGFSQGNDYFVDEQSARDSSRCKISK